MKGKTYSEDYLKVRSSRARGRVGELFKDTGVQSRKSNVIDDVVGNEAGSVSFPLCDGRSELSWVAKDVVKTGISGYVEYIGEEWVILQVLSN